MTETSNRVPAGVPTGGQFAASARAEAGVTLAASPTDTITDIGQARLFADTVAAKTARFGDLMSCVGEARDIRAKHPSARYAVLVDVERREYDDLGDTQTRVHVFDENMDEIDMYYSERDPLHYGVPTQVADEKWTSAWGEDDVHHLNVDAAARLDVVDAEAAFREDIAFEAVAALQCESFIITPGVLSEKVTDVIDDAQVGNLQPGDQITQAQRDEVVRRVMDDEALETAFYPTYRAVDALVAKHVEDVVKEETR